MKIVIVLLAFLALALSFLLNFLSLKAYVGLAVFFFVASVVLLLSKKQKLFGCFFACLLLSFLCVRAVASLSSIENAKSIEGKKVYFEAVVVESSSYYEFTDSKFAVLKVTSENGKIKKGEKISFVYFFHTMLKVGQKVQGNFLVSSFEENKNKNSFYAEGIYYSAISNDDIIITNGNNFHYNTLAKMQGFINKTLRKNTKNSAVLISMIYGEKGYISNEFYNAVKVCGVSHVLVVSGFHFSLIFLIISFLCSLLSLKGLKKDIAMLLVAIFYVGVCGFSVSVIRVALVYLLTFISRRLKRIHSSLDCLIVTLVLVLLINPFSIFSISFQLSFEATFGLLVLYPEIKKHIDIRFKNHNIIKGLLNTAAVSISAFIFTLPTVIYYFAYIATYTVVVNLLIGFAIPFMLGGSVIALLLCALGSTALSSVAFFISDFFAEYFRGVVLYFSKLPLATLDVRKNNELLSVILIVLYAVVYELYTCKIRRSLVKYFKKEESE